MFRHWTKVWIAIFLLGVCGCAASSNNGAPINRECAVGLHEQALVTMPEKICIFPVKVDIGELDAMGATELVPEWSAQGVEVVQKCVTEHAQSNLGVKIVPLPEFSPENKQILDHYRALYELASANKDYIDGIPAWSHLKGRLATIGPGMSGFKEQLGADAILFVSGYDFHSSAGRKAAAVLMVALAGAMPSMGFCDLRTGLVDVQSGDILWSFSNKSDAYSLKNEQHVQQMLNKSFSTFPTFRKQESEHATNQ